MLVLGIIEDIGITFDNYFDDLDYYIDRSSTLNDMMETTRDTLDLLGYDDLDNFNRINGQLQLNQTVMLGMSQKKLSSTTDEVKIGKNCPDIYLLTSKRLGVSPEECLVFEDILEAVKGAKLANMTVFAVHDKYAEYQKEDLIKTADEYICNFNDIKIKNLFL